MDKMNTSKELIWKLGLYVFGMLGTCVLIVFLVDPFFHYHKPWFGLQAVQTTYQYQTKGAIEHLDYDSILAGSSVVMSIDTKILDEKYGCKTIKTVGNSAPTPLLLDYLKCAFENREINNVFYGLDVFAFYNDPNMQIYDSEIDYINNNNPFDDIQYLLNGTVIGEKVPDMVISSITGNYAPNLAYSFNQNRATGSEVVFEHYWSQIQEGEFDEKPYDEDNVLENIQNLETIVSEHLSTKFIFFLPPYSILWWDRAYEQGRYDTYINTLEVCMEKLLKYDNVEMYAVNFNDPDTIMDLDKYIDITHGGVAITEMMAEQIGNEKQKISYDNYKEEIKQLKNVIILFRKKVNEEGIEYVWDCWFN